MYKLIKKKIFFCKVYEKTLCNLNFRNIQIEELYFIYNIFMQYKERRFEFVWKLTCKAYSTLFDIESLHETEENMNLLRNRLYIVF